MLLRIRMASDNRKPLQNRLNYKGNDHHSYHKGTGFQQLIQGRKQFFSLCLVAPGNLSHGCRMFSHLWFY